jgi:GTP-binding protein YchF
LEKKARSGDKEAKKELCLLERIKDTLEGENLVSCLNFDEEELELVKRFHLLTMKQFLVVANVAEQIFSDFDEEVFRKKVHIDSDIPIIPICAKIEAELAELSDQEADEFLLEIGAKQSGLQNLIQNAFDILGLENYFTAGVKEVRSWTIRKGSTAPQAAGEIHTDFQKGFIKAEVISYEDYISHRGELGAKEAGKVRTEGKQYIVQDGDVMHFKFHV